VVFGDALSELCPWSLTTVISSFLVPHRCAGYGLTFSLVLVITGPRRIRPGVRADGGRPVHHKLARHATCADGPLRRGQRL